VPLAEKAAAPPPGGKPHASGDAQRSRCLLLYPAGNERAAPEDGLWGGKTPSVPGASAH
jgi:hypothetical protein